MDLRTVYKMTCKDSEQEHVCIFLYKISKIWIHEISHQELLR
jgi:hypothetical protein